VPRLRNLGPAVSVPGPGPRAERAGPVHRLPAGLLSLGGLDGDTARQTDSRWFNVKVTFVGGEGNAESGAPEGWSEDDTGLHRDFRFSDFATAWRFMGFVAAEAERMDHHPDWSNSYDRVSITLISHDKGRVTGRDHRLAALIDDIFAAVSKVDR